MYKPGDLVWLDGEPGVVDEQQPGDTGVVPVRLASGARQHAFKTRHLCHITNAEIVTLAEAMAGAKWGKTECGGWLLLTFGGPYATSSATGRWHVYTRMTRSLASGLVVSDEHGDVVAEASRAFVRLCIEGTIKPVEGWDKRGGVAMYTAGDLAWLGSEPVVVTRAQSGAASVLRIGGQEVWESISSLRPMTREQLLAWSERLSEGRWYPHHGAQGGSLCDTDSDAHSLLARWRGEAWDVYSADGTVVSGTTGGIAAASAEVIRRAIMAGEAKRPATASSLPTLPLRVGEHITEVATSEGRRFRLTSAWEEC